MHDDMQSCLLTYCDIVANDGWQGSVLCVVLSYVNYAVVLNVAVFPDLDAVDITCRHLDNSMKYALPHSSHVAQQLTTPEAGESAPATAVVMRAAKRYIPRNTAPYHTDELFPSVTSPIIDEFGATKISSASCGFLLLKAWSVLCFDTARITVTLCALVVHPCDVAMFGHQNDSRRSSDGPGALHVSR